MKKQDFTDEQYKSATAVASEMIEIILRGTHVVPYDLMIATMMQVNLTFCAITKRPGLALEAIRNLILDETCDENIAKMIKNKQASFER